MKLRKVMAYGRTSGHRFIDYYETLDGRFQIRNHSIGADRYWTLTDTERESNLPMAVANNFSLAEAKEAVQIILDSEEAGTSKKVTQKVIARNGEVRVIRITLTEFETCRRRWYKLVRGPGLPARRCSTKKEAMRLFDAIKAGGGK